MSEELNLVRDLALILVASGIFTILSKVLRQPLILGYIVAGFLVGPHMGLLPTVTNAATVKEWSEIGIIFLLFGLGLEFSFKKLIKVGSAALITAGVNCLGMFLLGMLLGALMGWTMMECVFLGGMLSMSSTTIIIKAYKDMGLNGKPYAPLVFGILVVEDLIAVLLMVLLSTLAVSRQFSGGEMLFAIAKLAFFLILWFLVGIFVIPSLLKRFRSYLTDEILLLVSIGLCFGMVSLASYLGFSSALGAFVMGSILSETMEGERIARLTGPIKDLFGAVFFVSVGMMVDPAVLLQHWLPILLITFTVMLGIGLFSMSGALLSGKGFSTATHTAFSLLQLGEFSFIIAGMGCSLGVLRDFIYPVIISVSVITTFTTPYVIRAADPAEKWLRGHLPSKLLARIDHADAGVQNTAAARSEWRILLKAYLMRILLYGVLLVAIVIAAGLWLPALFSALLPDASQTLQGILSSVLTLAVMAPFLYGMSISGSSIKASASKLIRENRMNAWPVLALLVLRVLIGLAFSVAVIAHNVALSPLALLVLIVFLLVVFMVVRRYFHRFSALEDRFMDNLNQKENENRRRRPVSASVLDKMSRYGVSLQEFGIAPESPYVGRLLRDLPFRSEAGVNIVKIQRGGKAILVPPGTTPVYPGDILVAVGTEEQLRRLSGLLQEKAPAVEEKAEKFKLDRIVLGPASYLTGKTLRESGMRAGGCMVIGILRGDDFVTNPSPDFRFAEGDGVWIAGNAGSVDWYMGSK